MYKTVKDKKVEDPRTTIVEARCKVCGKIFCPAPYHVYKDDKRMYCSWSCFNKRNIDK